MTVTSFLVKESFLYIRDWAKFCLFMDKQRNKLVQNKFVSFGGRATKKRSAKHKNPDLLSYCKFLFRISTSV